MLGLASIDHPEGASNLLTDRTLADMKSFAPGTAHCESTSTVLSHSAEKQQKHVSPDYSAAARSLDAEFDSHPGTPGPVESEL